MAICQGNAEQTNINLDLIKFSSESYYKEQMFLMNSMLPFMIMEEVMELFLHIYIVQKNKFLLKYCLAKINVILLRMKKKLLFIPKQTIYK